MGGERLSSVSVSDNNTGGERLSGVSVSDNNTGGERLSGVSVSDNNTGGERLSGVCQVTHGVARKVGDQVSVVSISATGVTRGYCCHPCCRGDKRLG